MKCPNCAEVVAMSSKFCPECGVSMLDPAGAARINTGGGDIHARDVHQAGRDLTIIHGQSPEQTQAPAVYGTRWSWSSPVTQAALGWTSLGLTVAAGVFAFLGVEPTLAAFAGDLSAVSLGATEWLWGFIASLFFLVLTMAGWRLVKSGTFAVGPSWLPAVTGWGGRLGLARLQGRCSIDGGALRFYNRPVRWVENLETGARGRVLEREMSAECVNNSRHAWPIEVTDEPAEFVPR